MRQLFDISPGQKRAMDLAVEAMRRQGHHIVEFELEATIDRLNFAFFK